MSGFDLSDYVDVKQRIELFYKKYPDGVLRFEFKGVLEHNPEMIWGIAYAYRSPDDPLPAIGTAQELAIGRTPYTKSSELMNLESSAWGRAIGALGIGLHAGIATAQEVKLAKDRQIAEDEKLRRTNSVTPKQVELITALFEGNIAERDEYIKTWKTLHGYDDTVKLSSTQAGQIIDTLKQEGRVPKYKRKSTENDPIKDE